jgi:antitoxin component YwqK of YwqJK toxin-antitoxin module
MKRTIFIIALLFFLIFGYSQTKPLNPNGYNKIYYPNGSLQSEGKLMNGKPEGYWINYYPTGVKKSEGTRTNHQLDSIWIFYNLVGDTVSKISYLNGNKNGYLIKFFEKPTQYIGNIRSKELYVNDKIEGIAFYYYPSGKIKEEANYANNKREGYSYEYAEDGRLITIFNYRKGSIKERTKLNRYNLNNEKNGLWQEFYAGFRLKKESYYENGLLDGYYKEYDPQGKLVLTLLYRDGKLIETVTEAEIESIEQKEFYEDGTIKATGSYLQDKPVGIHKKFDRSGEVTVTLIYNDNSELVEKGIINNEGYRTGEWETFYPDGKVKAKGKYENNRKEGNWKYFFENGSVEQEGAYSKGKYAGIWKWYYPTGELWKEEEYYNGREEGIYYEYDIYGNILVEGEYFDGEKEGKWRTIINDYRAEGAYVTGLLDGKWKHYHDNGTLAFEGTYVQGNAEGKHRYFFADGTLKEEQFYNNGIREKHWKKFNEFGELIITISYKNNQEYRINGIRIDFPTEASTIID